MKITRDQFNNLRKQLIKFCSDTHQDKILTIQELLIDYPEAVEVVKNYHNLNKGVKSDYTSTGHGAFGEPEGYIDYFVCGKVVGWKDAILIDKDENPVAVAKYINIEELIKLCEQKFAEQKQSEIDAFKI